MHLAALCLVLAGAVIHALWNLLAKQAAGGTLFVWAYSVVVAVLYLPLAIWGVAASGARWTWIALAAIVASGVLHLIYALALQAGYRRADLSIVYPTARGTGPILSVIGAIALLGEPLAVATMLGAALVVGGVFTIGLAGRRGGAHVWPGLRWGLFIGLFIASYTLNDGAAVRRLAVSPIVLDYFGNLVRCVALAPVALAHRSELAAEVRRSAKVILGVGAIVPIPYLLTLYAMTIAPVSLVAPAREVSVMVGVLFGRWVLKEPSTSARFAGATLVAAGVAVLALG
jgi:drug/metabolite transporter (DMT)-like permease